MGAYKPIAERLAAKTIRSAEGCLIWTGATRSNGYGVIGMPRGGVGQAHRVAYELARGPIPDGLHIDHLCRNRACVEPTHLEAVTQAENNRRAGAARTTVTTTCSRGHGFTPENTMRTKRGRMCRTCHNARNRAARAPVESLALACALAPDLADLDLIDLEGGTAA